MNKKISVSVEKKIEKFNKKIKIPGDKSCSIRAILLASQCIGISKIKNLLESEDVLNCVKILKKSLGIKILKKKSIYHVCGNGLNSFRTKKKLTKSPEYNINLGSFYIGGLLLEYDGAYPFAIAAYNAGPNAVKRWIEKNGHREEDEFVELISYRETRGYVKRVLTSYYVYHELYSTRCSGSSLDKAC